MKLPKLTKKHWIILSVVVLFLVAAIGYWIYRKRQKAKLAEASSDSEAKVIPMPVEAEKADFSNCPDDSFPLKYGKCGKRVEQFQLYLIKQYGAQFSTYGVDGKWGNETEAIAKKFILKNAPFTISEDYFNKTGMGTYKTLKYA